MEKLLKLVRTLHEDESGQDLIEYALVAALIAFGAVTAMNGLAGKINTAFDHIGTNLTNSIS